MSRPALIIADALGMDSGGFEGEYRYQPTRTTRAIYNVCGSYYATGKRPPKDVVGQPWVANSYQGHEAQKANTTVWESKELEE